MAQAPSAARSIPGRPEPDRSQWPDDAKEEHDALLDWNEALARVNSDQVRVIQGLRAMVDLKEGQEE